MYVINLLRSTILGGRFRVFINDVEIDKDCCEVNVGDTFKLCLIEHKVFSYTSNYKEELLDILVRRGSRYGGSSDDVYPPCYTVYSCVVKVNSNAVLSIKMNKKLFGSKTAVFKVNISEGSITDSTSQICLTEEEFSKYRKLSRWSLCAIGLFLLIVVLITSILGGIVGFLFFGGVSLITFLSMAIPSCLYLKKLKKMKLVNDTMFCKKEQ